MFEPGYSLAITMNHNDSIPSIEEMRTAEILAEVMQQNTQMMEQFQNLHLMYALHSSDDSTAKALANIATELALQREIFMHRIVQNALWQGATLEHLEQRLSVLESKLETQSETKSETQTAFSSGNHDSSHLSAEDL
jgi:hypothetical protein